MAWFITLILLIIAVIIAIWFLNRYYRKASRETALVRTGFGGKQVILDGGCLALPFLNQIAEVNMKTTRLEVSREMSDSLITQDRLRVDITVEFYLRVQPHADGVATAAQALAGKTFRAAELQEIIEGKLIGAMQGVVAQLTMDQLHESRLEFVNQIKTAVSDDLKRNGLELESVSLTRLDQTPFQALDENNAFNAVGMRRLAEVIAANRKQRAVIEADADVAVKQSQLEATKRKFTIEREEEEAQIEQQLSIATLKADQTAKIAESTATADQRSEAARIDKERRLREMELNTQLTLQIAERQNDIDLARKSSEVAQAQAEADQIRAQAATAAEAIQTAKDKSIAERARQIALIRAQEHAEVSNQRSQSAAESMLKQAQATAEANTLRAKTRQTELEVEAQGRKSLAEADNVLSDAIIKMRLEQHKLDTLPELAAQMVKPVEKIEGIRINQISGLGGIPTSSNSTEKPLVNQAIDGLMGMAVQLPALQKLGQELGINMEQGLASLGNSSGNTVADDIEDKQSKAKSNPDAGEN